MTTAIEPPVTAVSLASDLLCDGALQTEDSVPTVIAAAWGSAEKRVAGFLFAAPERASPAPTAPYLWSYQKRLMDVCVAATLLCCVLPLLVMVAFAIKATSRGPILFRQDRVGAAGRHFRIYKFRSMKNESCRSGDAAQVCRNDPRVTTVGRFLRRSSIDELPQLLNVLRGEMSLVGPRPHSVFDDRFYAERIPLYRKRLAVRPGLTGLAQVRGARGATPTVTDMVRRVSLDAEYIRYASMPGDLFILLASAREMLLSKTAC